MRKFFLAMLALLGAFFALAAGTAAISPKPDGLTGVFIVHTPAKKSKTETVTVVYTGPDGKSNSLSAEVSFNGQDGKNPDTPQQKAQKIAGAINAAANKEGHPIAASAHRNVVHVDEGSGVTITRMHKTHNAREDDDVIPPGGGVGELLIGSIEFSGTVSGVDLDGGIAPALHIRVAGRNIAIPLVYGDELLNVACRAVDKLGEHGIRACVNGTDEILIFIPRDSHSLGATSDDRAMDISYGIGTL